MRCGVIQRSAWFEQARETQWRQMQQFYGSFVFITPLISLTNFILLLYTCKSTVTQKRTLAKLGCLSANFFLFASSLVGGLNGNEDHCLDALCPKKNTIQCKLKYVRQKRFSTFCQRCTYWVNWFYLCFVPLLAKVPLHSNKLVIVSVVRAS